ncbi:hypothetical protein [Streptomyces sp. NPDC058092]|uniref:hypothetical protein n=1 Tax=Streptomyces sp. NPDC058092 TaxID=3346336 RepID=UPI0036E81FD8
MAPTEVHVPLAEGSQHLVGPDSARLARHFRLRNHYAPLVALSLRSPHDRSTALSAGCRRVRRANPSRSTGSSGVAGRHRRRPHVPDLQLLRQPLLGPDIVHAASLGEPDDETSVNPLFSGHEQGRIEIYRTV